MTGRERNEWIAFFKLEAERMNPEAKNSGGAVQEAKNDSAFRQWVDRAKKAGS